LLGAAALLSACGGSTGVRDEGKPPAVQATAHAVKLWFIRPGGRVGVERDLVPVTIQISGYPNQVPKLTLLALERGPSARLRALGYRTVVGCCAGLHQRSAGGGPASRIKRNFLVRTVNAGWTDVSVQDSYYSWLKIAGATQVIRTLGALPSAGRIEVMGITGGNLRKMLPVMARGIDRGRTRPRRTGSCASARQQGGIAVGVNQTAPARVRVHVRAPEPVVIEFGQGQGAAPWIVEATAATCGAWDVTFPGAEVQFGRFFGTLPLQVRVTALAGLPTPGVTRQFTLHAPPAPAAGA
jgi:hypothetical protein